MTTDRCRVVSAGGADYFMPKGLKEEQEGMQGGHRAESGE